MDNINETSYWPKLGNLLHVYLIIEIDMMINPAYDVVR